MSSGFRPPPGLSLPAPPGLALPECTPPLIAGEGDQEFWEPDCSTAEPSEAPMLSSPDISSDSLPQAPQVLRLEEVLPAPQEAPPPKAVLELAVALERCAAPCPGSELHGVGRCKPCHFMYRASTCREGAACKFCHLCGPQAARQYRKLQRALCRRAGG
mmetsp:Transcript_40085/g.93072  ORF Transcript_40085/g.93072 Transcript_40085/m.93072 type:complete len:159 (+) Transcript_40085:42-518(+)